jgi:phage terminase small subunit
MGDKLTPKQQGYSDDVISGMSQVDAYKNNYATSGMSEKTIHEEASRLAAHPKISARRFEAQSAAQERNIVTIQSITAELDQARDLADRLKNPAAMTGAIMGKAKVNGLLIDKVDAKQTFNVTISRDDADL